MSAGDRSGAPPAVQRSSADALRLVIFGLVLSALLGVVKLLAGVLGHSNALVADGIESGLDIVGSLILWGGINVASAPADHNHPYGHGKAESLAALAISVLLFGAAAGIAIESVRDLMAPGQPPAPWTLIVLAVVTGAKFLLGRALLRVSSSTSSTLLQADAYHHISDAVTSAAAFVGISCAVLGGPSWIAADSIAALFAAGVIAFNGRRVFVRSVAEVMDSAPSSDLIEAIRRTASEIDGVRGVDKVMVRKSGTGYLVDIHVEVEGSISVHAGHEIARAVRRALYTSSLRISDTLVHVEPFSD